MDGQRRAPLLSRRDEPAIRWTRHLLDLGQIDLAAADLCRYSPHSFRGPRCALAPEGHWSFGFYFSFARDTTVSKSRCALPLTSWGFYLLAIAGFVSASGCQVASSGLNAEGTRHFLSGNHRAAVQRFHEAVQADPHNPDSYYNLGATYHQIAKVHGDDTYWSQAENYYHQCLDKAELRQLEHVDCYRGLTVLLVDRGQNDKAFTLLQRWTKNNTRSVEAKVELARLHHEFGDSAGEEEQLLAAAQLDPHHARARAALGTIREKEGDLTGALNNYAHSLSSNRVQPHVAARMAAIQSSTGAGTPVLPPSQPGARYANTPTLPFH